MLAAIERSDNYAELSWKTFAPGVSVTGLMVYVVNLMRSEWPSGTEALFAVVTTLVARAACALS